MTNIEIDTMKAIQSMSRTLSAMANNNNELYSLAKAIYIERSCGYADLALCNPEACFKRAKAFISYWNEHKDELAESVKNFEK